MDRSKGLIPSIQRGFVLAVSAPSGTGKTSLCDRLAVQFDFCIRSISVTTRPQREGERNHQDYEFVSESEFKALENQGAFLESANVFGNSYGTPRKPVEDALAEGKIIVMDIDTQGALRVKTQLKEECVTVFVVPPSFEELERRLKQRGKDAENILQKRLSEATREMTEAKNYEYVMANIAFDSAYLQLQSIVLAERAKRLRLRLPF